jgi:hypothetical protein
MPEGIGPRDYILDESGRDITSRSKRRLGDYLSSRTRGGAESFTPPVQGGGDYTYMPPRPNAFPVTEGTTEIPADASRESPGAFAPDLGSSTNSQDLRSVVTVVPSAERSVNGGVSGHEAVNSQKARSAAEGVLGSNRFTSRGKFTSRSFASATPESPESFTGQGPDTGKNVFESMRKAALTSMLNAAGGVAGPGGGLVTMSSVEGAQLKSVLPRIGIPNSFGSITDELRVKTEALRPASDRSRIESGSPLEFEGSEPGDDDAADISPRVAFDQSDISGASPTRYNGRTYGQLNSYLQSFSGSGTLDAVPIVLLAYAALFIASAIVSLIISLIVNKMPRPDPTTDVLPLGSERGADFGTALFGGGDSSGGSSFSDILQNLGGLIAKILGVMQPYDGDIGILQYFLAATEGSLAILGIGGSLGSSISNALINVSLSPGFYLTLVREVARDLALFVDVAQSDSSFIGTLQAFRSSKLVRFVDTCARLGIVNGKALDSDTSMEPDSPAGGSYPAGGDPSSPVGAILNSYETAQLRVSRSRESTGSKRLAWSHTSLGYTRSELVTEGLVKSLGRQRMVTDGGLMTGLSGLRDLRARKVTSTTGRISPKDRAYHEQLLDSEYMPFYFHDVRTNEILSFHAFLSALSDSYSANYTSTDGFGRMDPVQTYKNTTRSISFSFVVVATGPDDHSQMWHSVNKLVNMIYPQWSEGDRLEYDGNVYTQPFSQTIAASPMVRVRIGDVIHSNYSRFALERIFGLELKDSALKETKDAEPIKLYEQPSDKDSPDGDYAKIIKDTTTGVTSPATSADSVTPDLHNLNAIPLGVVDNNAFDVIGANFALLFGTKVTVKPSPGLRYKFYEQDPRLPGRQAPNRERLDREITGTVVGYAQGRRIIAREQFAKVIVELSDDYFKEKSFGRELTFKYVEVSSNEVEVIGAYASPGPPPIAAPATIDANGTTVGAIDNFLSPINNPIVRSFEEGAGGRGLAGFIQALGLEYGDADNTWTVERGSRAPNMVKVSVTFLPIHDIPMGLSSDGTARAAAYPVGSVTRKRHFPGLVQNDIDMATALRKK